MSYVIIGNGIAGVSAAIELRSHSAEEIVLISKESKDHISRPGLMYLYMNQILPKDIIIHTAEALAQQGIKTIQATVNKLDEKSKTIQLVQADTTKELTYNKLLIACGATTKMYDWPGQAMDGVSGFCTLQDLQYIEKHTHDISSAAVIGGGLIGVELAEMFRARDLEVHFLIRDHQFWHTGLMPEEAAIVHKHMQNFGVHVHLNSSLQSIHADEVGRVAYIKDQKENQYPCQFVGIATGVQAQVQWLGSRPWVDAHGIVVDAQLRTSNSSIFAAGDCVYFNFSHEPALQRQTTWYAAKRMGICAAQNMLGNHLAYNSHFTYNAAKFFELEFQSFGDVMNPQQQAYAQVFWQAEAQSIRIAFDAADQSVQGFHVLGLRFRQSICERWLEQKTPIQEVLAQLELADFNEEFTPQYGPAIRAIFEKQFGQKIESKAKRSRNQLLDYMLKGLKL